MLMLSYVFCVHTDRKERKVFEMYKIEALAARDRKDKADIETLRNEVRIIGYLNVAGTALR